jgi:hypothetical protein
VQFEELAKQVAHVAALTSPPPYGVLDSHPQRGEPTDPRMQLATLAYYYLLADPESTFLLYNGGNEPATPWQRHWIPAAAYDIGQPDGQWSAFATGADPSQAALTYRVYQRSYAKALVLYKPLSYRQGNPNTVPLGEETATPHELGGRYQPLRADGTRGEPITRIRLRNGEGAILLKMPP